MKSTRFTTTVNPDLERLHAILNADPEHPHIHNIDMPFRLTSTWQDQGCEIGIWKAGDRLLAWTVFQPPWWNLDYALRPSERGSSLEEEILAWGQEQIFGYSKRTGEDFYGSVEFFEDTPKAGQTADHLERLGFKKFDWSTVRFELDLHRDLPQPQLPKGFTIRPLRGYAEVQAYVGLHRAAFGSDKMTAPWRMRTLEHPDYRPEIDLVVVSPEDKPVGFCICWMRQEIGQIEPLGLHPDVQGKGLGRGLELAALQTMRNQGARFVVVDHVSLNKKAIALSTQTGFKQRNNALRYFINANPKI